MKDITIRDLLEGGVHFGHPTRNWNPKMSPYIFGARDKIHIIDLEKTLPLLKEAMNFLGRIASKKGKILFVGTKLAAQVLVKETAEKCDMPYVNHRWLGGMLTNYKTVRGLMKRLKTLESQFEKGAFGNRTKKEILNLTREKEKLERTVGGIKKIGGLPDALFVIDVGHEKIAVREANKLKIPVVGIVDTVNDPDCIDYVIPGNDDAMRAIKLYLDVVCESISSGKTSRGVGIVEEQQTVSGDEFVEVSEKELEEEVLEPKVEDQTTEREEDQK